MRSSVSSNSFINCPKKCTVWELAEQYFPKKLHHTVGAFVNNQSEIVDLRTLLTQGDKVRFVFIPSPEALEVVRHSAAHVMAQAVQELWPDVKVTIGPVIENGFYYDFDVAKVFRPEDLSTIEKKMQSIINQKLELTKEMWTMEKALSTFKKMNEPYKLELIQDIDQPELSIYRQGKWLDLCRGPHVKNLSQIGAVKVLNQSGAYWRGDENNKQLKRIYGTAFHCKKDLKQYLQNLESAKLYDHRKLGKEMDLFYFSDLAPGSPFFTSKGTVIYNELQKFLKTMYQKYHYKEVITPQVFEEELFNKSGHKKHFADNMYPVQTKQVKKDSKVSHKEFFLKPMNCPGHCLFYSFKRHSYKELPMRVADFGRLHRREKRGTLHGLTRVTSLCQDDAHIFCTLEQLKSEIQLCLKMFQEVYELLGLTHFKVALSTRPKESMGSDAIWQKAESALEDALHVSNISFYVQKGEGAFYGPKLDWQVVDTMHRTWQLGTLQCDFNMPQAFNLRYIDKDNQEKVPILLHRAVLGSLERFIGVYLEHTKGYVPLWLSPYSVLLANISQEQEVYVKQLQHLLQQKGVRVKTDLRNEKLGYKIRTARLSRQACVVVIGQKEQQLGTVSVRLPKDGKQIQLDKDDFVNKLEHIVKQRQYDWISVLTQTKEVSHS